MNSIKMFRLLAALTWLSVILLAGCQTSKVTNQEAKPVATPTPKQDLKAEDILNAVKAAKFPIEKDEVYTAENDPNKLMGRPNQYMGKASWNDKRIDSSIVRDRNATVEVFASAEDLETRRSYVDRVNKVASPLAQYQFVHKNALLRLSHKLTPAQAAEYEKLLKGL